MANTTLTNIAAELTQVAARLRDVYDGLRLR